MNEKDSFDSEERKSALLASENHLMMRKIKIHLRIVKIIAE
jgi:hypothetical protein